MGVAGTEDMSEVPDFWGVQEDVYCAVRHRPELVDIDFVDVRSKLQCLCNLF